MTDANVSDAEDCDESAASAGLSIGTGATAGSPSSAACDADVPLARLDKPTVALERSASPEQQASAVASSSAIDIIYEEGPCLVVSKPAGLLTQAPLGIDSLEARVKAYYQAREQKTGNIYLGVPHRLDRPASGCLIFARHVRAARRISKQFENRTIEKIYWACVAGQVEPAAGTWCDCIRKVPGEPLATVVSADHPEGRTAVLYYRTLGNFAWGTWLEIKLETGRTHQVRVQAAVRGWPILGDTTYGSSVPFGTQHEDVRLRAIALHARSLAFVHPMNRARIEVTASVSDAWQAIGLPLSL